MKLYTENFTIILNKHITNTEIDTYEFRVLCYLLMLADDEGVCFPSYKHDCRKNRHRRNEGKECCQASD